MGVEIGDYFCIFFIISSLANLTSSSVTIKMIFYSKIKTLRCIFLSEPRYFLVS